MTGNHRNTDAVQEDLNLSPQADTSATTSPSSLIAPTDVLVASSPSSLRPDPQDPVHLSPSQTRKPRRDKPRIDLALDQPPTTHGRPRARVFVACVQCRGRKIRCDGAKPVCYHCSQREGDDQCTYDALPKRRGPDRIQGARTRNAKSTDGGEPPRRRRRRPTVMTVVQAAAGGSYGISRPRVTAKPSALDTLGDPRLVVHRQPDDGAVHTPDPDRVETPGNKLLFSTSTSYTQMLTFESTSSGHPVRHSRVISSVVGYDNADGATFQTTGASFGETLPATYALLEDDRSEQEHNDITPDPSVQFSREVWWDHLLYLYAVSMRVVHGSPSLGPTQRNDSISQIIKDVRFAFRSSSYWFSFLNVPRFYNTFMDPLRRNRMQPSLLLSLLAVSIFLQSPERAYPEDGRRMAVLLRDEAQGYLEASLHSRAIDEELAQAAWVLAFFEVCAHPQHRMTRIHSSLNILDSIIRSLGITYLDAGKPAVSTFSHNVVPDVEARSEQYLPASERYTASMSMSSPTQQYVYQQPIFVDATIRASNCPCDDLSLGLHWPEAQAQVPLWVTTPMWNREWSEGEIKKEECRRLCWSTLMLVSGHTSFANAVSWRHLDLFVAEPSNYSILFPGESLVALHPHAHMHVAGGKDTVWALYLRAMLLWNTCVRVRHDTSIGDLDRRDFAMRAWMETEAIEKALHRHTCSVERALMYNGREFLFNTRMCISYEFQRFIPHVLVGLNRNKSEEWLRAQGKRAKTVIFAMHAVTGNDKNTLLQRPYFMWWFVGQVCRALTLWQHDNSLTIALDVCKAFLEPIEFLANFYPGPVQHTRLGELRERVRLAVLAAEATGEYVPTPIQML
ncbi:hypothetical protein F5148DRAFT_974976 [Russula earlei]|uniref:Uncharacterized protein n=1 Tax=Russula earlei TaxID=71964 RepID=A0ACC0UKC4_9AGAM|nr:hypothetical protein F5148DRAFT_974976 [Russula earlei]